jgi:hypothetical protein
VPPYGRGLNGWFEAGVQKQLQTRLCCLRSPHPGVDFQGGRTGALQHFIKFFALQRMEHHHFVQAVHKLGRKLPRAASTAVLSTFSFNPLAGMSFDWTKPIPPCISSVISPPPRFEVRKITVCDRSTLRLSPTLKSLYPVSEGAVAKVRRSLCHPWPAILPDAAFQGLDDDLSLGLFES